MTPLGWTVVLTLTSLAMLRLGWEQVQTWRYRATVRRRLLAYKERIGYDRLRPEPAEGLLEDVLSADAHDITCRECGMDRTHKPGCVRDSWTS